MSNSETNQIPTDIPNTQPIPLSKSTSKASNPRGKINLNSFLANSLSSSQIQLNVSLNYLPTFLLEVVRSF